MKEHFLQHISVSALYITIMWQLIVITFIVAISVLLRLFNLRSKRNARHTTFSVREKIFEAIESGCAFNHDQSTWKNIPLEIFIPLIEDLDKSRIDSAWEHIRHELIRHYAIPRAKNWYKKTNVTKRFLATRSFALDPQESDGAILSILIKDVNYSVRSEAMTAALKLSSLNLFKEVFDQAENEPLDSLYPLKDCLQNAQPLLAQWGLELLSQTENEKIVIVLLQGLSKNSHVDLTKELEKCISSNDPLVRAYATKLSCGSKTFEKTLLLPLIADTDMAVRENVMDALFSIMGQTALPHLEKGLDDVSWHVRLAAASNLVKSGANGRAILDQKKEIDAVKYATALFEVSL